MPNPALQQTINDLEHSLVDYDLSTEDENSACWQSRALLAEAYFSFGESLELEAQKISDSSQQHALFLEATKFIHKAYSLTCLKKAIDKITLGKPISESHDNHFIPPNLSPEHLFLTGMQYYSGIGVDKSYHLAYLYFLKAEESNYAPAICGLGCLYEFGYGVSKDPEKALAYYKKAAQQEYPEAQFALGIMLKKKDKKEAAIWFRKAAIQGYVEAQTSLALLLEEDKSSIAEAFKWNQIAAKQNNPIGQNNLAWMYDHGFGVAQNKFEAFAWYLTSASQDYVTAQSNVGIMYLNGEGVAKNTVQALFWLSMAAAKGHVDAQYRIGLIYENGEDQCEYPVKKDIMESTTWYRKAWKNGHSMAYFKLRNLYETDSMPVTLALKYCRQDYQEGIKPALKFMEKLTCGELSNATIHYKFAMIEITDQQLSSCHAFAMSALSLTTRKLFDFIFNWPEVFLDEAIKDESLTISQRQVLLQTFYNQLLRSSHMHMLNEDRHSKLFFTLGTILYESLASENLVNNSVMQKKVAYQAYEYFSKVIDTHSTYEEAAAGMLNIISRYNPSDWWNTYVRLFHFKKKIHPIYSDLDQNSYLYKEFIDNMETENQSDNMEKEAAVKLSRCLSFFSKSSLELSIKNKIELKRIKK